jgi:hypothetical protein
MVESTGASKVQNFILDQSRSFETFITIESMLAPFPSLSEASSLCHTEASRKVGTADYMGLPSAPDMFAASLENSTEQQPQMDPEASTDDIRPPSALTSTLHNQQGYFCNS